MTTTHETVNESTAANANGHKRGRTIPTTPIADRSLGELVATMSRDLALLIHQEIELLKAEFVATVLKAAVGAAGLAVAAVGLLLAVPLLSIAAALGVHALGISLGFSFLIIGGAYVLVGLLAAGFGAMALRKTKAPTRAVGSMKADMRAIVRKPKPAPPLN